MRHIASSTISIVWLLATLACGPSGLIGGSVGGEGTEAPGPSSDAGGVDVQIADLAHTRIAIAPVTAQPDGAAQGWRKDG